MKALINFWVKHTTRLHGDIFRRSNLKTTVENPLISLAPKVLETEQELASVQPYLDRIGQALATKDINNIAITGNYGSGKSTIIRTFQHLNKDKYRYLNISLASFTEIKNPGADFERRLEISILQQMFYKVPPSKIPDSRFKRIRTLERRKLILIASLGVIWIFSAICLFYFDFISLLNPRVWSLKLDLDFASILSAAVFFLGVGILATKLYKLFVNSRINKINIKGELEIDNQHQTSIFNQYLEEILYYFIKTDVNVVIIEDVDRFGSTEIFVKLRELNILINQSQEINRNVKFLYAIKDEMFARKDERVKFFELIIPIIPFVNASNANEQIEKLIKDAGLTGSLSKDFTSDVVTFIDDIDMRLLLNVFMEYQLYRSLLNDSLSQDALFAIIVYKNQDPDDFGKLQRREGILFNLFAAIPNFYASFKADLLQQVDVLKDEMKRNELEKNISLKELRTVYLTHLSTQLPDFEAFQVGGRKTIVQAADEEYFEQIRNNDVVFYMKFDRNYRQSQIAEFTVEFNEIEKKVSTRGTYAQREKAIIEWTKNRNSSLIERIRTIENEIKVLESMSLVQLFKRFRDEELLGAFKDNKLVRSLLVNGYINEHYEDYISIFHEVSLTKQDFKYERSVKSATSLPFNHPLERFDTLLKRIPIHYLAKDAALNFDILTYLCKNIDDEFERFKAFVQGFQKMDKKRMDFIVEFIEVDAQSAKVFITRGSEISLDYFLLLFEENAALTYEMNHVLKFHFENLSNQSLDDLDKGKYLKNHLEHKQDFFDFAETLSHTTHLLEFVKRHNAKIQELDVPSNRMIEEVKSVYNQSLYALNRRNIHILVDALNLIEKSDKLDNALLSNIYEAGLKPMIDYLEQDINTFLNEVILTEALNTEESQETILKILDSVDVAGDTKAAIIRTQHFVLDDSTQFNDAFLQYELIKFKKIKPTWPNVIHFIELAEDNEFERFIQILIEFVNVEENYLHLSSELLSDHSKDNAMREAISNFMLYSPELTEEAFIALLNSVDLVEIEFDFSAISPQRISILIQQGLVELNQDNFMELESKKDKLHIQLIEAHLEYFIQDDTELALTAQNWAELLNSMAIRQQEKNRLIALINLDLINSSKELRGSVYRNLPKDKPLSMSADFWALMFGASDSLENKIKLFLINAHVFNNVEVMKLVSCFGESYEKLFKSQHKPSFPWNSEHIALADFLCARGLIKRYEFKEEKGAIKMHANY